MVKLKPESFRIQLLSGTISCVLLGRRKREALRIVNLRKITFSKIKPISLVNRLILKSLGLSGCHGLGVARLSCSHFNWLTASKYQAMSNSLEFESSPDTCAVRTSLGETPGTQEMTFWFSVLCNPPQTEASKLSHTRTFENSVEIQMR